MSNELPMDAGCRRMRANRKVVEVNCQTCRVPFVFGEEVCECEVCGAFHHAGCWAASLGCRHDVSGSPPVEPATVALPPTSAGLGQPSASPKTPGADEQYCSQCREIIKLDALKCRFCGTVLNAELKAQEIPDSVAKQAASFANAALWSGIIGLFICAPILGSMAISNGNKAIALLDTYPLYAGPRGKANAGRVLGWIAWILFVIVIIGRVSNSR
jgi:hypothetical protein